MTQARPNLLFVFPDQLGARWMGCYRNPIVQTPVLDAFAQENCCFTQAYTNSPICTPYRGCLFTGRYPCQTGVTENGHALPAQETMLADCLNDAGYHTSYVGKWHLSGAPHCNRWVPPAQRGGFQEFVGWESHHVDHYVGRIWEDDPNSPFIMLGHETDALTDIAIERLERAGRRQPFAMFVAYQAPHPPCTPPDEYAQQYQGRDLCLDPSSDRSAWFSNSAWQANYDLHTFRERYFGEISHLDAAFARILRRLTELGLSDNTIVIFSSDHGEMNGCHGRFGKEVMYQESVHVPLLIRMPGQTGRQVSQPVSTVDLLPTLLDLAAACAKPDAEGESFASLLRGNKVDSRERPVFIEYQQSCVIQGRLKLVADYAAHKPLALYDMLCDPYELHNLVADAEQEDTVQGLLERLQNWRRRVGTRFEQ